MRTSNYDRYKFDLHARGLCWNLNDLSVQLVGERFAYFVESTYRTPDTDINRCIFLASYQSAVVFTASTHEPIVG